MRLRWVLVATAVCTGCFGAPGKPGSNGTSAGTTVANSTGSGNGTGGTTEGTTGTNGGTTGDDGGPSAASRPTVCLSIGGSCGEAAAGSPGASKTSCCASCSTDADCHYSDCETGTCCASWSSVCAISSDCGAGQACQCGECCQDVGSPCEPDSPEACCGNMFCNPVASGGRACCVATGLKCVGDSDCCTGQCSSGLCACSGAGAACENNSDCCSGSCSASHSCR